MKKAKKKEDDGLSPKNHLFIAALSTSEGRHKEAMRKVAEAHRKAVDSKA